ncbi:MAG: ABC transporter ATP-binding protein [Candidatus Woesearchaeota archaeon]|nr:ABC transporter ATP-binding protein [Candidatus Woesearchaeota archaeon]
MPGDAVFTLKNVNKKYGPKQVLQNVSFDINRGEVLGLIGASGAGKTTLLHMLVGFIPSSSGDIIFKQHTRKGLKDRNVLHNQHLISKTYGFASQHPSFYEKLTVIENLHYFGGMYGQTTETVDKNAKTLLGLMGLKSNMHLLAQHLSGGMKRRLDIACALIHNPSILILDEPTADLDPVLRNQIWDIIKTINAKGTTVILSSHHLNELDTLCSRIAIIKDGNLVDIDTPEKLKAKYSSVQEIMIESFPGNYEKITKYLKGVDIHQEGTSLIIKTTSPETVISQVLAILKKQKESLLDLKLVKPNLDNVFVEIYGKKKAKKEIAPVNTEDVA